MAVLQALQGVFAGELMLEKGKIEKRDPNDQQPSSTGRFLRNIALSIGAGLAFGLFCFYMLPAAITICTAISMGLFACSGVMFYCVCSDWKMDKDIKKQLQLKEAKKKKKEEKEKQKKKKAMEKEMKEENKEEKKNGSSTFGTLISNMSLFSIPEENDKDIEDEEKISEDNIESKNHHSKDLSSSFSLSSRSDSNGLEEESSDEDEDENNKVPYVPPRSPIGGMRLSS